MTNPTTATVEEYLEFARQDDLEGATAYLETHFKKEDGELDETALQTFIETAMTAADAEVNATEEVTDEAEVGGAEAPAIHEQCDTTTEVEVSEAPSES